MAPTEAVKMYGNHLRVRVGGIAVQDGKILLVKHDGLNASGVFWSPPGGGLEFNETIPEAIQREFREETGLEVKVGDFLFINEFKANLLHAVELFFAVEISSGQLLTGMDPEVTEQIIGEVKFMSMEEIKALRADEVHNLFRNCQKIGDLFAITGYITN